MKTLEEQIRDALGIFSDQTGGTTVGPCPGDETLVLLVEGGLPEEARASICEHLVACPRCLEIVSLDVSIDGLCCSEASGHSFYNIIGAGGTISTCEDS